MLKVKWFLNILLTTLVSSMAFGQTDTLSYWRNQITFNIHEMEKAAYTDQEEFFTLQLSESVKMVYGELDANYAVSQDVLGLLYMRLGDYVKAEDYFRKSLAITHAVVGTEHELYASSTENLGDLYKRTGEYEKAELAYREAIEIYGKTIGSESEKNARCLNALGVLYLEKGLFQKAKTCLLEALELRRNVLGEAHPDYATSLSNVGNIHLEMGEFLEAEKKLLKAAEIVLIALGERHATYASSIIRVGMLYEQMGNYLEAKSYYLKAKEIRELTVGLKSVEYAEVLGLLGRLNTHLIEYESAENQLLESLRIKREVFGRNDVTSIVTLINLGALYLDMGALSKAESALLEAQQITVTKFGQNHPNLASIQNNLATLYANLGNWDLSLEHNMSAMDIIESIYGVNHPDYAKSLNNIALDFQNLQRLEKAEQYYLLAAEKTRAIFGEEHIGYAEILQNLGVLYSDGGNWNKGLDYLNHALKISKAALGENHPDYALLLSNIGITHTELKNFSAAEDHLLRALKIIRENYEEDDFDNLLLHYSISELYDIMGEYDNSVTFYNKTQEIFIRNLAKSFSFLSDIEKTNYLMSIRYIQTVISSFQYAFSNQIPILGATAYNLTIAMKGAILKERISMANQIHSSQDTSVLNDYNSYQLIMAELHQSKRSSTGIGNQMANQKRLKKDSERIEKNLVRTSSEFAEMQKLGNLKWQDIQSELDDNQVAIEFSSFTYYRPGGEFSDSTVYVALVLRKDDECPIMVKLFEEKQLDSLFQKGDHDRELIADLYRGAVAVGDNDGPSYGKRLYELLWQPLDSLLNEGDNVYFAPSGLLHRIALSAIPYGDTEQLLSDRYQLNRLSTTAKLVTDRDKKETRPKDIVLFGGIDYELKPKAHESNKEDEVYVSRALPMDIDRGNTSWSYLPGTLKEIESIATIAGKQKINVRTYTGTNATEEEIKSLGGKNSPTVLHIASHGFFFPDPERDLEQDRMMQMMGDREQVYRYSDDPLNRAGLLFAGASHTWNGEEVPQGMEDGILTANEATYIPLTNTELVVLSACETGIGEIKGSEGVFGLQRAFKAAGAEYVMMSLWKVPDQETSEFMQLFYGEYLSDHTIPDSYHYAQKIMRNKYPDDPYKWAGFVLMR
jgi:tetratricopeptide (TPR) repeat protein/CHAT domain-containing protein